MLGAITGDVVGSAFEFNNTKNYDFLLLADNHDFTDDSIMTVAVADWLLHDAEHTYQGLEDRLLTWGRRFSNPMGGIRRRFPYLVVPAERPEGL